MDMSLSKLQEMMGRKAYCTSWSPKEFDTTEGLNNKE